jgi:hypothetical protein
LICRSPRNCADARLLLTRPQVKILKQPKFDISKLLELHSASTETEVGQKVQREFVEVSCAGAGPDLLLGLTDIFPASVQPAVLESV